MSWDDEDATQIFSGADELVGATWQVNLTEHETRSMTALEVGVEFGRGNLSLRDTFVWREGMTDWLPLGDCAELRGNLQQQASRRPPAVEERPPQSSSTMVLEEQYPRPAATAPIPRGSHATMVGMGAFAQPRAGAAAAPAAPRPGAFGVPGAAPPPRRLQPTAPSLPPPAAPLGAVPDAGAYGGQPGYAVPAGAAYPYPSAPPQATMGSYSPPSGAAELAIASARMPQPGGGGARLGLVVAVVGAVLVLGVAGLFFAFRTPAASTAQAGAPAVETPSAPPTDDARAAQARGADDSSGTAPTTAGSGVLDATANAGAGTAASDGGKSVARDDGKSTTDDKKSDASDKSGDKKSDAGEKKSDAGDKSDDKKSDAGDKADEKADDKKSGEPFSVDAARSALSRAASAAGGCGKSGGPTGRGRATVTFGPSGAATSASVDPPFAGTPTGSCALGAFRAARVPPFSGSSQTVTKSFFVK